MTSIAYIWIFDLKIIHLIHPFIHSEHSVNRKPRKTLIVYRHHTRSYLFCPISKIFKNSLQTQEKQGRSLTLLCLVIH